jgi:hypothetical protein
MLTVHVRINDAVSGKATPVRLRVVDGTGRLHVPFGRLAEFATGRGQDVGGHLMVGGERVTYIDGACEVRLPPGSVTIEATKGPEFSPLLRTVTLGPGQISIRLTMERSVDLRAEGWYSGDTRTTLIPPHAALLEAAAEDLAFVNLLALETPPPATLPNLLAFSGGQPALEMPGHQVVVNTLNTHPFLGTLTLLNCHRIVHPLRFGRPDGLDDWSLSDWCDQCHRKKTGLVVWPDLPRLTPEHPQGEALAAMLRGQIDAFEISRFDVGEPAPLGDWYRLLNCGLRVPLVGASGKDSNAVALGACRTYARVAVGETPSYAAWIDAVRAGRTFVTNGPILTLTVDGLGPGTVLQVPEGGRTARVRVEGRGVVPIDRVETLLNGVVVADRQAEVLEAELPVSSGGWLAARCRSAGGRTICAHTSPVYLQKEGQPLRPGVETIAPLDAVLSRSLDWVRYEARPGCETHRAHLMEVFEDARTKLSKLASR